MNKKSITINAILNGIRQLCTIIFPLITIPYVSRILGSSNFGKINFAHTFVGYFSLFAAFGVSTYAIREGAKLRNNPKKLNEFANEVFSINIYTTILSYLLMFILIIFWTKLKDYKILILIHSTIIFFTTIGIDWTNNIFEDFFYITCRFVIIQIILLISLFIFVKRQNDYIIYAIITALASILGNIINIFYIRKKYIKIKFVRNCNLKKHFKAMLYLFGNTLASTVYVYSDIILLTSMKGDIVTGIYSVSTKIYIMIKQLINAMLSVVIPRTSIFISENKYDEYKELMNSILYFVLLVSLPATVGLFMLSKPIILIISGSEYITGFIALRILSFAISISILSYLMIYLIMVPLGMEKQSLIITIVSALINIILNFVFIKIWSLNGAALTTCISELIVFITSHLIASKRIKISIKIKSLIPMIIGTISVLLVCMVIQHIFNNIFIILILSVLISVLIYGTILLLFKDKYAISILNKVLKNKK